MKKFFIIGLLCLAFVGLILASAGSFAESLPAAEKIAELQKTIDQVNQLREQADNVYERAVQETVAEFEDAFNEAGTEAERENILRQARQFLQNKLAALNWPALCKAKDNAYQKIIEAVDKAYEIDTSNVQGEPTFSQDVEGEGECYSDGRVRIGPSAFGSPGLLASTKKHEATHADQAKEGRWPHGAVQVHDAEIEAYGREITSADTVGLSDEERSEVQRRLQDHLESKKVAMINEIETARGVMDNQAQIDELDKIAGKIRDVIELEESGDEEGAIEKKDDAIEELDQLIRGAKGEAQDTLKELKEHVKELKEAELFVIKAGTIEDLRDARDAPTSSQAQKDEITKIIGKIKNLISAERKNEEDKALEIKKDALKEINDLLKNAKGATKDNLKKAKEKVETLIKIESKITVSGKTEAVGEGPDGSVVILVHTKECSRYTVTCSPGTKVKLGQTITVTGTKTDPGKIKATSLTYTPTLAERKVVKEDQYYQGPKVPLPQDGAYGSFVITPDTKVAVKKNGATSSFFINEEGEVEEGLDEEGDYFVGLIKPGVIGVVTAGIIDAIFSPQEKLPEKTPGIEVSPHYDGVISDPVIINVEDISLTQLEEYTLLVEDLETGKITNYGSPDLYLIDEKGSANCTYSLGELSTGSKDFLFTDPKGKILDEKKVDVYEYFLSFTPSQVTRGMPVFGNIDVLGMEGKDKVQVYLSFDPVLGAEVIGGELVSKIPGVLVFMVTVDEVNQNSVDFKFDTSKGLGQQQVKLTVTPFE